MSAYMLNTVGRFVQPRIIFKIVVHDKIAQKGTLLGLDLPR
jgi:hypothetical protein